METSYFGKYFHEKNINEKLRLDAVLLQDKYEKETILLKSQLSKSQEIIDSYQHHYAVHTFTLKV